MLTEQEKQHLAQLRGFVAFDALLKYLREKEESILSAIEKGEDLEGNGLLFRALRRVYKIVELAPAEAHEFVTEDKITRASERIRMPMPEPFGDDIYPELEGLDS